MADARARLIADLLQRAVDVSEAACELLTAQRPSRLEVSSKSGATDIVTDMDRRSEALIVERLTQGRPDDGVLAEEGSAHQPDSGVRWVIDPIDGTVNYLYGIPIWAVCIGVELEGEPVAGVVAAPELGETYFGSQGTGAWLRSRVAERRIQVGAATDLSMALVATGFGYSVERRTKQAATVAELLPRVRDIRRAGTASVDICWLASARVDGYYEVGLKPWDHTAACVIAREAGAIMTGPPGEPPSGRMVMGANRALYPKLLDVLQAAGAWVGPGVDAP